jgi:hypothetical protein
MFVRDLLKEKYFLDIFYILDSKIQISVSESSSNFWPFNIYVLVTAYGQGLVSAKDLKKFVSLWSPVYESKPV